MDIEELQKRIENHEERIAKLEAKFSIEEAPLPKKQSIKEFLIQMKPESDVQKTLFIGYYLEHHDKIAPFNLRDLESGFNQAKEPSPKNLNEAVNKNIAKGLLMEANVKKDNLKAWVLTNSGETAVKGKIDGSRTASE